MVGLTKKIALIGVLWALVISIFPLWSVDTAGAQTLPPGDDVPIVPPSDIPAADDFVTSRYPLGSSSSPISYRDVLGITAGGTEAAHGSCTIGFAPYRPGADGEGDAPRTDLAIHPDQGEVLHVAYRQVTSFSDPSWVARPYPQLLRRMTDVDYISVIRCVGVLPWDDLGEDDAYPRMLMWAQRNPTTAGPRTQSAVYGAVDAAEISGGVPGDRSPLRDTIALSSRLLTYPVTPGENNAYCLVDPCAPSEWGYLYEVVSGHTGWYRTGLSDCGVGLNAFYPPVMTTAGQQTAAVSNSCYAAIGSHSTRWNRTSAGGWDPVTLCWNREFDEEVPYLESDRCWRSVVAGFNYPGNGGVQTGSGNLRGAYGGTSAGSVVAESPAELFEKLGFPLVLPEGADPAYVAETMEMFEFGTVPQQLQDTRCEVGNALVAVGPPPLTENHVRHTVTPSASRDLVPILYVEEGDHLLVSTRMQGCQGVQYRMGGGPWENAIRDQNENNDQYALITKEALTSMQMDIEIRYRMIDTYSEPMWITRTEGDMAIFDFDAALSVSRLTACADGFGSGWRDALDLGNWIGMIVCLVDELVFPDIGFQSQLERVIARSGERVPFQWIIGVGSFFEGSLQGIQFGRGRCSEEIWSAGSNNPAITFGPCGTLRVSDQRIRALAVGLIWMSAIGAVFAFSPLRTTKKQ